ncbi:alpha/beta hydrolase-fold protein [Pseudomonas sp. S 311-6]|nr:alpha/beta hydrolase-fold protein [Pseudomonas sp. S 311-6]
MLRRHFLLAAACVPASTFAQQQSSPSPSPPPRRRWDEPIGPTVADLPSDYYEFERLLFDSRDGKRHYRVYVGVPRKPAPPEGYPVIYMLDGNAAMHTLKDQDLAALFENNPPVLVGIGYDVPSRHDVMARAFDYTPPILNADGTIQTNTVERGRPGGGADLFLDLIQDTIRPAVAARVPLDSTRQTLWGHSFGGLFTLYALVTRPRMFQRYVAGDPSVGWGDDALLKRAGRFHADQAPDVIVRIMVGRGRAPAPLPSVSGPVSTPPPGRESTHALVSRLAQEGMDITFQAFPAQSHGELFATSLHPALALAATR